MNKILIITLALFVTIPTQADDKKMREAMVNLYGASQPYEDFFYKYTRAVISNDRSTVASLNSYPIRVNYNKKTKYIKSKQEFIKKYDEIITKRIIEVVNKQKFEDLFASSNGLNIGLGHVWFNGYCVGKEPGHECDAIKVRVMAYNVE